MQGRTPDIVSWRPASGIRYVWATVEYDGTGYCGFQWQIGQPTVQGELERALAACTQEKIRITAAGRTDAGVHARGQVIAFHTAWRHPLADLERALNALLARDVAVRELALAEEGFHPRFSARSREYRYTVLNQPLRSPLARRFAHHWPHPLDVEAMDHAARALIGMHDFAAFGQPPQGENTVRQVMQAGCKREGPFVYFDIEANAFLRRMVRSIVGTLLQVGSGKLS
ncbi:MAG: tRNA pseudouridine(38-40) synthase TruA, partial [Chloroflexota bacterium]|nr:tRNA pseudouridine(38-40) synthase TruA [Chloroflexota bacterium]